MNIQEQNETIAILCGYYKDTENRWRRQGGAYRSVPNYINCLNAIRYAEVALKDKLGNNWVIEYERNLIEVMRKDLDQPKIPFLWMASAHQKAEAVLKTIGKWKE